ncbi:hypothetical protein XENOCAPTIV_005511 [Xenoophorus captivus]|uniref:Histone deacetylase n=1 Tax=Xenoophorus captivus TaxID=1517983 RepID=A0ABV0Q3K9_9TELE
MPIAHEFSPDVVLVSAGFDAVEGHPPSLGGYMVEPLSQSLLDQKPCENAVRSLQRIVQIQGEFWQSVRESAATVDLSYLQAQRHRFRRDSDSEAVNAIASLSMRSLTSER